MSDIRDLRTRLDNMACLSGMSYKSIGMLYEITEHLDDIDVEGGFARLRELAEAERTKQETQEPKPMGLQTIYFTPYSCDYCGDHIAVGWAFCPECGHRTKNKLAATEPKGDEAK